MSDPWIGIKCDWHQPPESAALKNAVRLVEAGRSAGFPPSGATTGKWLSVCLFWDGGRTEVEVFADRFELYFLPRSPEDDTFDVVHHDAAAPDTIAVLIERIRTTRAGIHGYATTIHKNQGAMVDRAFVMASGTMDRHLTYVAMTRHRDGAQLYAAQDDFADRHAGRLVEHGAALFEHKDGNRPSYFVTLENDKADRAMIQSGDPVRYQCMVWAEWIFTNNIEALERCVEDMQQSGQDRQCTVTVKTPVQ